MTRRVHPTEPPQVDYALAARGRSLVPAPGWLARWAEEFGAGAGAPRA